MIYGAEGAIGSAVVRAFAREGAKVHLTGRTLERLEEVAEEIRSSGGVAETAQVDAIDEQAVNERADAVAASAGGIDVSFNLISFGDVQGTPLAEMPLQHFERPVMTAVRTQFLTSTAARHMIRQGSGVILFFGSYGDPVPHYYLGGLQVTEGIVGQTMLKRAATLEDVGSVAAFAASDHARTMTATALNISCGAIVD